MEEAAQKEDVVQLLEQTRKEKVRISLSLRNSIISICDRDRLRWRRWTCQESE